MHAVVALTVASDGVVVLGGVVALVRAAWRVVRAVEKIGQRLDGHERRIAALEVVRGRGA